MKKMKKILAVILLAALALTLTACGNGSEKKPAETGAAPTVTEMKETEAPAEAGNAPAVTEAPAEAKETEAPAEAAPAAALAERVEAAVPDAGDLAPFTADELMDMAGIAPEDCADFVFLQGDGMDGREILVIRAADEAAADRVAGQMKSYLQRRMDEMENYAPKAYQLLSAAKVERKGLLLALVSGENAEAEAAQILAGE